MAKKCDICGNKIGFKGFHCQDGIICKQCYSVVSNGFRDTITGKTLSELKKTYEINRVPLRMGEEGFQTSRRVGTLLLIDERNRKFCIPGNPTITKEYGRPEIYRYDELQGYKLVCDPELFPEELTNLKEDKKNMKVIKKLKVRLRVRGTGIRDIAIVSSPVRSSSFAFRQAYQIAMKIIKELDDIYET
ncbi:MAG: DUF4428 domain-containing protein, partial [Eubacteriales bacterium]|nr:DUF4428 domain-containing protein [Eubacteriales bacterium]